MIVYPDGREISGIVALDNPPRFDAYAIIVKPFVLDVYRMEVRTDSGFYLMTDYFRTEQEAVEHKQFVRDLLALRFPNAFELTPQLLKELQDERH